MPCRNSFFECSPKPWNFPILARTIQNSLILHMLVRSFVCLDQQRQQVFNFSRLSRKTTPRIRINPFILKTISIYDIDRRENFPTKHKKHNEETQTKKPCHRNPSISMPIFSPQVAIIPYFEPDFISILLYQIQSYCHCDPFVLETRSNHSYI